MPDDIREMIEAVQEKSGCIPNVFLALAHRPADLSDRERHTIGFALKTAGDSASIVDADLDAMRAAGFDDDEIWDIGAITAFFAMSNRLANLTSMRPNDEFYAMAR